MELFGHCHDEAFQHPRIANGLAGQEDPVLERETGVRDPQDGITAVGSCGPSPPLPEEDDATRR
jgi:hypothetical protein